MERKWMNAWIDGNKGVKGRQAGKEGREERKGWKRRDEKGERKGVNEQRSEGTRNILHRFCSPDSKERSGACAQ